MLHFGDICRRKVDERKYGSIGEVIVKKISHTHRHFPMDNSGREVEHYRVRLNLRLTPKSCVVVGKLLLESSGVLVCWS